MKYEVGSILYYHHEKSGTTHIGEVTEHVNIFDWPNYKILVLDSQYNGNDVPKMAGKWMHANESSLDDPGEGVYVEKINTHNNNCECDILELMNLGCRCGGV